MHTINLYLQYKRPGKILSCATAPSTASTTSLEETVGAGQSPVVVGL